MNTANPNDALLQDLIKHAQPVEGRASDDCFISSAEFAALDVSHEWMIDRTMVRYEPMIVGGPKKSLKTSTVLELAISLAGGFNTRFLGKFDITRPYRVGLISGESGKATLKKKAVAICKSKGMKLENLPLHLRFRMPRFSVNEDREAIVEAVKSEGFEVMIFDPMYLGLLAENSKVSASDVMAMGPVLQEVVNTCLPYGCTPVLVHHTKKLGHRESNRPLDLDDLSQSGFAEFARQWILLSRRTAYRDGSGEHELWMRCGGSAGHSSLRGIDVDEGGSNNGIAGERWKVTVRNLSQINQRKESEKKEKAESKNNQFVNRLVEHMEQNPDGDTKTGIREALKVNSKNIGHIIDLALERHLIVTGKVTKGSKEHDGFLVAPLDDEHPDNPDTPDGLVCPAEDDPDGQGPL